MSTSIRLNISLFDLLLSQLGNRSPILRCTKATLIQLSHTLEDIVIREKLPALLFTGFQESSHWAQEEERYRIIANIVKRVYIFSGKPTPPDATSTSFHIELAQDDALHQEWFVLIVSDRFSALLCGKDLLSNVIEEEAREFDTIMSFEPEIILTALDVIEKALEQYRPDRLPDFKAARTKYALGFNDLRLVSECFGKILLYEEHLQQHLTLQKRLTDTLLRSIRHHLYVLSIKDATAVDAMDVFSVVYQSPNFERLSGYPVQHLLDSISFWETYCVHPEDRLKYDLFTNAMAQGKSGELIYQFIHADGSIHWISDAVTVVVDSVKGIKMVYGVAEDITEFKKMQEAEREQEHLRLELEKQRELANLKNQFMYNISHEFRVPLTTIMLSTEMLLKYQDRLDKNASEAKLKTIQSQVKHLRQMLDDIWTILNDELGQVGFHPEPTALHLFFEETIQDLTLADQGRHTLRLEIDIPKTEYEVDVKLLKQTVINLVSNAIKYSAAGTEVCCMVEQNHHHLIIRVKDHGIGIPEDDQKRLFEPFFRGNNVGTIGGAGLGLRIVQDCVRLQGGTIQVESALNTGTTFIVRLPVLQ